MFPPDVGGAETYAFEIASALAERGHEVTVYTTEPASDGEMPTTADVTVRRLIPRRRLLFIDTAYFSLVARREIDFEAYDVVHGTISPASTIALSPGIGMTDVPVVLTCHGLAIDFALRTIARSPTDYVLKYGLHPVNFLFDTIAGRTADRVIATSEYMREELIETSHLDPEAVSVIPHGIDTETFRPAAGQHGGVHPTVDPEALSVLFVGRLGPLKGVGLAIRAVAKLAADGVDAELLVAGTGGRESYLRGLAAELEITQQVRFLGAVAHEELPALYASADAFVLPSRFDSFGLVLLEAMACGTPVIGTDVGGIPTVIEDGTTGFLVSRSPTALAARLAALEDATLRTEMGRAARARAEELSWDSVAERVEGVYAAVCSDQGS